MNYLTGSRRIASAAAEAIAAEAGLRTSEKSVLARLPAVEFSSMREHGAGRIKAEARLVGDRNPLTDVFVTLSGLLSWSRLRLHAHACSFTNVRKADVSDILQLKKRPPDRQPFSRLGYGKGGYSFPVKSMFERLSVMVTCLEAKR